MNHSPPDVIPTYTRAGFLVSGVASLFAWVGYRLLTLGSGRASNWFARSLAATGLTARRIPHRGEIQDRNGYVLAVSEPVVVVCANPSLIADRAPQLAAVLESCLQIPKEKLIARLQLCPLRNAKGQVILDHRGRPVPGQREQLKSNVTLFEWRRIRESLKDAFFGLDPADKKQRELLKLLRGKAVFAEPAQARRYRFGALAAHIIGHVTADSGDSPFLVVGDINAPADFAAVLAQAQDPVSEFLLAAFTESARAEIRASMEPAADRTTLQQTLVAELNRIMQSGPLYHPQRFASVVLGSDTRALLSKCPEGIELVRLNRFLLADAHPHWLRKYTPVLPLQVGVAGIEQRCEEMLRGEVGWCRSQHDVRGREVPRFRQEDIPARDGLNVLLTLDARVQRIVEEELEVLMQRHVPVSATALVVHPASGSILASATLPTYLPEKPGASLPETWRNRAVCDVHELGSVMKMVTVTAALDQGVIRLTDVIFCENGEFHYKGKVLHDHHPYGNLSVEEILVHSSNIGAAKIALRLGGPWLHHYFRRFGFGTATGIPLPGERSGILQPVGTWRDVTLTRAAIGYTLSATPLQLTLAYCALGNGGVLMPPRLLEGVRNTAGNFRQYSLMPGRRVASVGTCRSVLDALTGVISPKGTAPAAVVPNYTAAGKTGTAEKWRKEGRIPGGYVSSFVGLLPASSPQLCVAVVVDEPKNGHFGGAVCGPAFARIAQRAAQLLNIAPDKPHRTA